MKHCGKLYSFKVSVRELGFRERATLNPEERLTHPADYKLINITKELDERFAGFAAEVCGRRLQQVFGGERESPSVAHLLPELTPEEEADRLGVREAIAEDLERMTQGLTDEQVRHWLDGVHPLEIFGLLARAKAQGVDATEKVREILADRGRWKEHFENYKYAYLFAIRHGKRGIRKYFAGWRVFCLLAASNIRYLLELVDQALSRHFDEERGPEEAVGPETQTRVAQDTGQRNLRELEGLSLNGAKLARLLLGLGRVFQVMAENPIGHTPEVNQFHLDANILDSGSREKVQELLGDGVMNLALLRHAGSKLQEQTDIRQFDYSIHPIFAAFFGFSHRRKRKVELSDRDILGLVDRPTEAIREIVGRQNREEDGELGELPEQMELFGEFYGARR